MQRSSADFMDERSAATGSTPSASGSDAEGGLDDGTQVSKKRKRGLKISCDLCKARKVKCDRVEPSCGWCARHNRVCTYQERKKPGMRVAYGRELEEKINRVEAILHVLGRRVEDHILEHAPPAQRHEPPQLNQQSSAFPLFQEFTPTSNPGVEYQNPRQSEPRWPEANPIDWTPPSRQSGVMSVQSIVDNTSPHHSMGQATSSSVPVTGFALDSSLLEPDLPPKDLLYTLVDLYFKHVNTWSPILDRKATFDALFGPSPLEAPDRILLHAIVATTLRFSKDPRLTPQSRLRYHDISKSKVQLYGLEYPNVRALQALVILALDILGTSNSPQSSNLLALISRNIVNLGLGVEKDVFIESPAYPSIGSLQSFVLPKPKSWIEDEERRRLFWMAFVLDRYATIATTFDFALNEREMDRRLPCRYDLFSINKPVETKWFRWPDRSETIMNKPENLGSFSYHCEVLRILTRIHRFLKKPIDIGSPAEVHEWRRIYRELGDELTTWLQTLPGEYGKISRLCHSDPASRIANWIMLHAAFVTSVIRLHSAAAYPTVRSHIFTPSYNASQRCLSAVESLREIAQDVINTGMLDLLGPPFAFSLWVSARLLLVHAATMESEVDPKIAFFISVLEQMGQYWEVAKSYAQILNLVVQENQQSQDGNRVRNQPNEPKTFTAMRRSAYDLSLITSKRTRPTVHQTSIQAPSPHELEYLEIFDFFNYPRLPAPLEEEPVGNGNTPHRNTNTITPTPPPPQNGLDAGAAAIGNVNTNNDINAAATATATTSLRSSPLDISSSSPSRNTVTNNDPFARKTSFAIPSRESDWFIFDPPGD